MSTVRVNSEPGLVQFRDVIVGLGGADTIRGLGGSDLTCGGPGKDSFDDGSGRNRLRQ